MLQEDSGISCIERKINEHMWQQVIIPARRQELLLSTVKRRKFGHVCRHDTLPKIILQGTVDGWVAEADRLNLGITT